MSPRMVSPVVSPFILLIFSCAVFFIGTTEFMLAPILQPLAEAFNTTTDKAAWLVSGYAFSYSLMAPIFGWLSDRINRPKLLLASLLFLSLDGLLLTIAPNLGVAIGLRIFGGIAAAALIPTIFALIAEIFPLHKQTSAMGIVMLGMTIGIVTGPVFAGVLTEIFNWQMPFLISAIGCFLLCILSQKQVLHLKYNSHQPSEKEKIKLQSVKFQWIFQGYLIRPLIAKGLWNGTAVSAFILSGEVLRRYYDLATDTIGISVSVFGIGLGIGNLSITFVKRRGIRDEYILLLAITLLFTSCTVFMLIPLSLFFSLSCLMLWGYAQGLAAPVSTSILANRAKQNKGQILAVSESFNNLTILFLLPIATVQLTQHSIVATMITLGSCLIAGIGLTLKDLLVTPSLN
ncbi:chloramphenicol/florfenicol exporter [Xenorhabdus stockiae]|uniref:Chloramphenicol/florfenicol exporter n=1 Tax=Xenorhabdus stockiae TaxID=351614 RepID=A0A2D0KW40_9GAMM|nr:MFS transporter [Xenorhabdus stockiae]PHM67621.1 chloramphenicol/florfenicol exporter [Xenorhabdus stockiae]